MKISSIGVNTYSKINNNKSFSAEQTQSIYEHTLNRLKRVNDTVYENFSIEKLEECMASLAEKYSCMGVKSIGIQIIGEKEINDFLGENAKNYDLKDKLGICVVVGDKFGPVERMTNIYEAKTFLASKSALANLK